MTDPDLIGGAPVPIVAKVKASTAGATAVAGLTLTILSAVQGDQLIAGWPDWVPVALGMCIAALTTFLAGYNAPHTARPDLPPDRR